ncbi:DNA polymerase III subunit alpha [Mangrovibacterium diazotrophicum]|uniref:DNA polymerase III subunit alpha n=1 Tax=Mangrovibacterium diazotrophicum TaxID=1261403 RepID=A0A419WB63_9BACT|nr:DNA polymerase III subunit alpha [Mangrovibacterium diazotrophicum]RKD92679.1 DNA polymerase III alpha subunit [Mangrovibacterium diazotrophicum]
MIPFTHLHVHSQYSILDGAASIKGLVGKAKKDGMTALALTDHGMMFGIKEFWDTCKKEGIKPILGCETYVASRTVADKSDKVDRSGDHLILLAKNRIGYVNLIKLISVAATDGFYYKPRIDKDLLKKHSEGLIVSSSCLGGEVPQHIMNTTMEEAEETVKWFKSVFGEDYYLELQRHKSEMPELNEQVYKYQVMVNERVLELAKKFDVKVICTNDVHFTNKEDADAHDLLICLNTGKDFDDPNRMRYTKQEWFKTQAEMNELFADVPEALRNTQDIVDKVEEFELNSSPIMPPFPIPEEFGTMEAYLEQFDEAAITEEFGENSVKRNGGYEKTVRVKLESDYLEHLTYDGAYVRYGNPLPHDVKERIDFELDTIKTMGFPGYFLIVQDFIAAARNMGVLVGPGRGSAAGAAVSYCVGITNIDPIKYDLLFERFLNPDRISMPDVDIDFDDDGRQMVLDWVTEKYGQDKVAHICTFGTMATKLAIRDVARVMKLPLPDADRLAKLVPEAPKMSFEKAYKESPELAAERDSDNPLVRDTLKYAGTLEGSVRQTGVHACGILISRDPLTDHIPIMPTKEEHLYTTQYDGRFVEAIGLLKMDFLGLKTLSIIKECLENIRLSKGIEVDIDSVPMDDEKTFELFSRGDTTAIFQFESPGMKKHLRNLKPNRFEDLVAMNALYRPGPMEYIPDYIERKHGRRKVEYDHPMMEKYLSDTHGITVFQEQVMLLSRHLGGFTRGDSDSLRKAMGKKLIAMMDKLKVKFVEGCKANPDFVEGCKQIGKENEIEKLVNKIWKDWEAFASYAFNKSHSVCYADIAYRTGYLKAHYPAEFMAANMSRNLSNIADITKLMEESKRMGINVLGPDVNESFLKFTVNKKGDVRFGMAAIKGVGAGAVSNIIETRKNGPFTDIFDFAERVNLQAVNKKNIEGLASAGAFDSFGLKRSQFFAGADENDAPFMEKLIKYGHQIQAESQNAMQSLFGEVMSAQAVKKPDIPNVPEFANLVMLEKEKSLIGIYLSAHPLDEYKLEFENFVSREFTLKNLNSNIDALKGREITFAGMVTEAFETVGKTGKPYSKLTLTDYEDSYTIFFFGKDYVEYGKYCKPNIFILVKGLVQESFRGGLEFRVKYIEMLEEVRKNQVKTVTVDVAIQAITPELVQNMESMSKQHKGTALLKFNLWDTETKTVVNLFSRNTRIEMNREIETFFRQQENLSFKIN